MQKLGNAVDFVENDKAVFVSIEERPRVPERVAVIQVFEVEIHRIRFASNLLREGGLSNLARTDKRNGWLPAKRFAYFGSGAPLNHPCILCLAGQIYKDD